MDKVAVKKFLESQLPRLQNEFGLSHWSISILLEPLKGDAAECRTADLGSYDRAILVFDHKKFKGEEDLLQILEHELLHVVSFAMEQYSRTIDKALPVQNGIKRLDNELFRHHNEQLIRSMERLIAGIRATAKGASNLESPEKQKPTV